MPNLNRVTLIGHLGRDPELRYTGSGKAVASVSLATTEKYNDKETTYWHRLTFWDKLAEIVSKYCTKGAPIYVEGRLTYREYEKDGVTKQVTEIVCDRMQMLGTKGDAAHKEPPARQDQPPRKTGGAPFSDMDEDIPL